MVGSVDGAENAIGRTLSLSGAKKGWLLFGSTAATLPSITRVGADRREIRRIELDLHLPQRHVIRPRQEGLTRDDRKLRRWGVGRNHCHRECVRVQIRDQRSDEVRAVH